MCELCGIYKCDSRCPYHHDPPRFAVCYNCGEDILDGDTYYDLSNSGTEQYWCEECINKCRETAEVEE